MPANERQRARAPRRKRARPSSQPPVMPRDDAHHRCTHPQRSATGPPPRRLPFFATPRSHSHLLHTSCAPTSSSRGHSYRDKADRERGGRRRGVVDGGRATSRAAPQQQTSRKEKGCPCFPPPHARGASQVAQGHSRRERAGRPARYLRALFPRPAGQKDPSSSPSSPSPSFAMGALVHHHTRHRRGASAQLPEGAVPQMTRRRSHPRRQ